MTLEGGLLGVIVADGVSLRIRDGELVDEGEHQTLRENMAKINYKSIFWFRLARERLQLRGETIHL